MEDVMTAWCRVRGTLVALLLFLGSLLGSVFFTGWFLPLLFLRPQSYRYIQDQLVGSWQMYAAALLEKLLGIRMVISGDVVRPNERSLIIMNHRTRLDWMYLWSVLVRQSGVKTEKIILKSPLKYIPGAGWAMQAGAFIFIQRQWESDRKYMTTMLDYFAAIGHKTQILLFPEGTDLTERSKECSDRFADKNGLPHLENLLHPRTTGFTFLAQHMRNNDMLEAVYDVSIAYPYNFPQNEPQLVCGNIPREVHFHVRRHAGADLPKSEPELAAWCQQRWTEKEDQLSKFYCNRRFVEGGDETTLEQNNNRSGVSLRLWIALTYWTVFVVAILVLLWLSSLARWFALVQVLGFVYLGHFCGGLELYQAKYFLRYFTQRKKDECNLKNQ